MWPWLPTVKFEAPRSSHLARVRLVLQHKQPGADMRVHKLCPDAAPPICRVCICGNAARVYLLRGMLSLPAVNT